ncbi:MAG: glycosyltransferase family 2 protein [Candidatus Hadarchaeales archaeon]
MVIPLYKGGKTLPNVVERIPKEIPTKILIVDDGSPDNSYEVAKSIASKNPKIIVFKHEKNRGYGGAQKTLFNEALKRGADIVVLLHQDGQYAPEDMPRLISPVLEDETIDIVLGSRTKMLEGGMPPIKFIGNKIITFLQNLALNTRFKEFHTGYRVYTANALRRLDYEACTNDLHFDTEILVDAVRKKLRVVEVPIKTYYGKEVTQTQKIVTYGLNCLKATWMYRLEILLSKFSFRDFL